jgi:phosphatidylglycerophosphate synthase
MTKKKPTRVKFYGETWFVRNIIRPLAQEVMLLIWHTNITPNQISFFRIFLMIPLSALILQNQSIYAFFSVLLFFFMEVLDHTDGMLARAKKISSIRGQFIEVIADDLTASPNFLLGIFVIYSLNDQFVLYSFMFSLSCERLFLYMKQNASIEAQVIKEITHSHNDDDSRYSKSISGRITDSLRAVFIFKPLILLIVFWFHSMNEELAVPFYYFIFVGLVWFYMTIKHLRDTWVRL